MVKDIMMKMCSASGDYVNLLLDNYEETYIKDVERLSRGSTNDEMNTFIITGTEQRQQKTSIDLLSNGAFKEGLAQSLILEIQEEYYDSVIGSKTVYVSHGGKCFKLV